MPELIAYGKAPKELVSLVRKVVKKTGARMPDLIGLSLVGPFNAASTKDLETGKTAIFFDPSNQGQFLQGLLAGVIAHELGHIELGHVDNDVASLAEEFAADAWATEHGYGKDLIAGYEVVRAFLGDGQGSTDHPPISERISAINRLLETKTLAAAA